MYQGNVRDFDVRFAAVEDTVKTWATSFLDVGCAEGRFAAGLAKYGRSVGVDYLPAKFDGFEFVRSRVDADAVDRLGSFDVTLLLSVLHHMPDGNDVFDVACRNSRMVIVELPELGEKFRHRKFDVSAVRKVMESDGVPLCSTRSVYGSHMRTVWAYQC